MNKLLLLLFFCRPLLSMDCGGIDPAEPQAPLYEEQMEIDCIEDIWERKMAYFLLNIERYDMAKQRKANRSPKQTSRERARDEKMQAIETAHIPPAGSKPDGQCIYGR